MTFFKLTTDKVVGQLRLVTLLVMLMDAACTLIGQPPIFWHDTATTNEGNPIVRLFLAHGVIPFVVGGILYIIFTLFIASITPRRVGVAILLFLLLGHYFGTCSWLLYYFHYGHGVLAVFQIAIAVLITLVICKEKH